MRNLRALFLPPTSFLIQCSRFPHPLIKNNKLFTYKCLLNSVEVQHLIHGPSGISSVTWSETSLPYPYSPWGGWGTLAVPSANCSRPLRKIISLSRSGHLDVFPVVGKDVMTSGPLSSLFKPATSRAIGVVYKFAHLGVIAYKNSVSSLSIQENPSSHLSGTRKKGILRSLIMHPGATQQGQYCGFQYPLILITLKLKK